MAVLDLQVGAGADDAEEKDDGFNFSSTETLVVLHDNSNAASRFNGGFRFLNVTVANANTIDLAYLSLNLDTTFFDDPNFNIHTENVDNAVSFVTTADVTSRARAASPVLWSALGVGTGFVNSPEIKTIIQARVNAAGWVSGNALVILCIPPGTTSQQFRAYTYDNDTTKAAKLHIEYTAGGAATAKGLIPLLRAGR